MGMEELEDLYNPFESLLAARRFNVVCLDQRVVRNVLAKSGLRALEAVRIRMIRRMGFRWERTHGPLEWWAA